MDLVAHPFAEFLTTSRQLRRSLVEPRHESPPLLLTIFLK